MYRECRAFYRLVVDELILYVRQEAYYNSVPDGAKITRAEQIERINSGETTDNKNDDDSEDDGTIPDSPSVSIQELQEIPMPEIQSGSEYLVAFLHSAGTASTVGMGLSGLSWQEIEAWAKCTDNVGIVTPMDLRVVHTLSRAYASESGRASLTGAIAPYKPVTSTELGDEMRLLVSDKVEDVFASMVAAQTRE